MTISQDCKYNNDIEISSDEYEIIKKFLSFYRDQSVIIADDYRQDFNMVPLETGAMFFKNNEEKWKSIKFCKRIFYKGKPYTVELVLSRVGDIEFLRIDEFKIITNTEVHFITLDTEYVINREILSGIVSIFDEKKIISPAQAYSKQMYTNKALQGFIGNHEWQNIDKGIEQMPELANALFIVGEDSKTNTIVGKNFETATHYTADFGTILYQLISFRLNNLKDFNEKDLRHLDELILKLRKTQLLKVQLLENDGGVQRTWPTYSILLESNNFKSQMHISKQYTVDNTELLEEQKVLSKCVKNLTQKRK